MLKNITVASTLVLFILLHAWLAVAADQKLLEDITFETLSGDEDRITFKLNGLYIPKIFAMKGENPRVVFDFQDIKPARLLKNIINTNGKFVKRIRMGIHYEPKPKTRVVFDLLPDKEVEFKHDFDTKKNTLIISVYHAGAEPDSKPEVLEEKKDAAPEKLETVTTSPATEPPTVEQEETPTKPTPPSAPVQTVTLPPEGKVAPAPQEPEPKLSDTQPPAQQEEEQTPVPAEAPEPDKASGSPVLSSITFDNSTNRGEMVLFKLNKFHPPIVFGVEKGLPRVVCDFEGVEAAPDVPDSIKTDGKYVHTIRIGRENTPKKVRVVLDLTSSKNYDLQQVFFKDDNLFVIIINTLSNTPTTEELENPLQ